MQRSRREKTIRKQLLDLIGLIYTTDIRHFRTTKQKKRERKRERDYYQETLLAASTIRNKRTRAFEDKTGTLRKCVCRQEVSEDYTISNHTSDLASYLSRVSVLYHNMWPVHNSSLHG